MTVRCGEYGPRGASLTVVPHESTGMEIQSGSLLSARSRAALRRGLLESLSSGSGSAGTGSG